MVSSWLAFLTSALSLEDEYSGLGQEDGGSDVSSFDTLEVCRISDVE